MLVHVVDVDLGLVIAFGIHHSGQLILVNLVHIQDEGRGRLSDEIGVRVCENLNVKVHLKQSVQVVTRSDDRLLDTNCIAISLDIDCLLLAVVRGQVRSILTVLVDDRGLVGHVRCNLGRVLSEQVVLEGVLTSVVGDGSQVLGGKGARSGDLHGVLEGEAARVA